MPKDPVKAALSAKSLLCPYPVVNAVGSGWTGSFTRPDNSLENADTTATQRRDDAESFPETLADDSPPSIGQNENATNLIVNYLPATMNQDDIRALFCSVGELESCKLIRDKVSGQSLGYGFVKYKRTRDARRAITSLNGLRLQNKVIKVSLARPSSDTIKGANLYISGLSKHMTSHDLHKLFSPFGDIITSRVLCDPQTGFSKGVGFIRYNLKSQAEHAIRDLNGSIPPAAKDPITVKFANQPTVNKPVVILSPSPQLTSAAICQAPLTTAVYPQNLQIFGTFPNAATSTITGVRYPTIPDPATALPLTTAIPSGTWTVFVNNLPPDVDDSTLWRLFGPFGAVQGVRVVRDPLTSKCKGFAFVTMSGFDDAIIAVTALNGQQMDGHVISLSLRKSSPAVAMASPTGYGIISGPGGMATNLAAPADVASGVELFPGAAAAAGGLQILGYQGIPGAMAMASVPNLGLTALPMM